MKIFGVRNDEVRVAAFFTLGLQSQTTLETFFVPIFFSFVFIS